MATLHLLEKLCYFHIVHSIFPTYIKIHSANEVLHEHFAVLLFVLSALNNLTTAPAESCEAPGDCNTRSRTVFKTLAASYYNSGLWPWHSGSLLLKQ